MQQVNLYTEDLKPRRMLFTFVPCVIGVGVLFGLLVISGIFLEFKARQAEAALHSAQQHEAELQSRIEGLQEQAQNLAPDPERLARNRRQEAMLASRRDLQQTIDSLIAEKRPLFSELLKGLARQSNDTLWLTGITIQGSGSDMRLTGATRSGEAVPAYLGRLRSEPAFRGRTFNLLAVEPSQASRYLEFSLSTEVGEEGE